MEKLDNHLLSSVLNELNNGVFILDKEYTIIYWNRFMAHYSQKNEDQTVGRNLFEVFPDLPQAWLKKKIKSALVLNTTLFTSWEQRPYIFPFPNTRLINSNIDYMYQDCVLSPIRRSKDASVEYLSISLYDATELALKHQEVQKTLEHLTEMNTIDGLTRVFNRQYLQNTLEMEFSNYKRHHHNVSLIMLDIDHFKQVNDTHGHLAGDEILCAVSQGIKELLRKGDIIGRYGGEEFMILLPMTDMKGAYLAAERVRARVEELETRFEEKTLKVTVSLGISTLSDQHQKVEDWVQEADAYLYQSKKNGRNRVSGGSGLKIG
jgi:diguanylate cyclase